MDGALHVPAVDDDRVGASKRPSPTAVRVTGRTAVGIREHVHSPSSDGVATESLR